MRNVLSSHAETAHVFASRSQVSGRAPDGRMYFDGPCLFSYGSHFILARVMIDPANNVPGVALLNSSGYSVSTGKHKTLTWRALSHYTTFYIPDLTELSDNVLRGLGRPGTKYLPTPADEPRQRYREETPAEVRARDRVALEAFVYAHPADLAPDAAAYLLGLAGVRNAPAVAARIVAKRTRDDKTKAAASAKALLAQSLNWAREFLEIPAADMPRHIKARESRVSISRGSYNYRTGERRPDAVTHYGPLEDLRALLVDGHKAAKSSGWNKARVARLWEALKLTRATLAHRAEVDHIRQARTHLRALIVTARQAIAGPASGLAWGSGPLERVRQVASELAEVLPAETPMGKARREALVAHARDFKAREAAAREAEAAERIAREAAARAAWMEGAANRFRSVDSQGRAYIRAVDVTRDESGTITGGDIETSQGAFVPLVHAIRAFRFLKLCHDKGRAWSTNGRSLPVGHYRVTQIEADGSFVAGCHRIGWAEVERVAVGLGIFDGPADESALVDSH